MPCACIETRLRIVIDTWVQNMILMFDKHICGLQYNFGFATACIHVPEIKLPQMSKGACEMSRGIGGDIKKCTLNQFSWLKLS